MTGLLIIVSGFASGVALRSLFIFSSEPIAFVVLLAALCAAFAFLKPRRVYTLGAVFFLFVSFGMVRTMVGDTPAPDAFLRDLNHRVSYEAVVVGDPDVREKNQRIALEVRSGETTVGMLAVMPLSARVTVGDRVRVYGSLSLPEAFETDGGRTFRYDKYLQARGIRFLISFGSIHALEQAPWYSLSAMFARIKHTFIDGLGRALPRPDSALASGIVIGGKQGLGTSLTDAFTRSGLVQIIVLSGYNIMVVAEWVVAFFALFALPRRLQLFAGGAALLLFVGIAGISATAVRAAIMAVIALYARATGRSYAASRALLAAVFLMLVWNPYYLCFDPGFGLSVAATAGIIWLSPRIEARLLRLRPFWRNTVATTLAAQISVLPLLLYNIGLFSLVALPANLLVNPLVPLAMASAAVAGVVGMTVGYFAPLLATLAGYPAYMLTRYFIFIAEKSSSLPYAAFTLERFPFLFVLAAYAVLIYFASSKRFSTTPQLRLAKNASM
ncbi:MAG: ComEC/Rec2 family competence protein [Candidatus Pacebacteria bacterium]|nr:ComEC/Rec2 family competence protein [Candidatus Paceibacterota bacterium]